MISPLLGWAVLINSALYLASVIAAGLVVHNGWAWRLGIFAVGLTYLCYFVQFAVSESDAWRELDDRVAGFFVLSSIIVGIFAGLALLF